MNKLVRKESRNTDSYLNLAAYVSESKVLGPGLRTVIWVQGCPFACPGCIAPEWIPIKKASYIKVDDLAREIKKNKKLTGITISGGEPMLQAPALIKLIKMIKRQNQLDVICFTGFLVEQILALPPQSEQRKLLELLDVLIDGPYISHLNNDKGLRGSSNQRIIRLSDRFSTYDLENQLRQLEITITKQSMMMIGIPTKSENSGINTSLLSIQRGMEG